MSQSDPIAAAVAPVVNDLVHRVPPSPTWFAINRKADVVDEADISIYDAIGAYGITADHFVNALRNITAKRINVRLNTPGGEIFDGTAIYNALRAHPAHVTVHVDGVAASAGSFIAMSGDDVRMADNAYMMIHNARGGVMGEASDMRRYADLLEKCNDNIASMYEKKTGKDRAHWRGLMDAETWFTAEEAKAEGLVDTVYTSTKKAGTVRAGFDFTIYNKLPDPVRRMWGINEPTKPAAESPLSSEADAVPTKETTAMADTSTANTASVSAAVVAPTPQTNAPDTNSLDGLRQITAQQYVERGVANGRVLERQAQHELMRSIVAVCPGKPELAINAFLTGQSPESVKLAFDAAQTAEQNANAQLQAERLNHAREMALAVAGGHFGVGASIANQKDDGIVFAPDTPPEVQAKMEWDANHGNCRAQCTESQWMASRVPTLRGAVRAYKGPGTSR
jgi:ATP-dependent Clp endopeptidase proteolytic subunit ClpP